MPPAFLARPACAALAALALLAGCATAPPAPPDRPRLVVLVVVDGLPQRQVTGYRDQLAADGLNRFLERGAWFSEAHFGQANTLTGPGHAAILTGAHPRATGIIGNEWRDAATGEWVYCVGDAAHGYIGHPQSKLAGTSPRNLRAETLGDAMRRADPRSKAVAISGKDRGAILLAGHAGAAYVYMAQTGEFASTTFYMNEHPPWVAAFNRAKPADRHFGATWSLLLPDMAYARSLADGQPWFASGGALPMTMGQGQDAPGPAFYASLYRSPFLDALSLDFALAALEGEALGGDEAPDLLAVSLSGHDYVNHSWGAESRLSHDHVLHVDLLLEGFFRELDRRVGKDRYVAVLTSDHGFMPAPEHLALQGQPSGRQHPGETIARLEAGLAAQFGQGPWTRGWSAQAVLLDRARAARQGVAAGALADSAKRILLAEPGVAAAFTRAEIEGAASPDTPWLEAVRKGWHAEISGDVQVVMRPGWILSSWRTGTTHGSPHRYDTHVPVMLHGAKWVRPGRRDERVEVVDIAPTLAAMLGIAPPASSEGRPLPVAP